MAEHRVAQEGDCSLEVVRKETHELYFQPDVAEVITKEIGAYQA
jgi:hypothetical protein